MLFETKYKIEELRSRWTPFKDDPDAYKVLYAPWYFPFKYRSHPLGLYTSRESAEKCIVREQANRRI